MGATVFQNISYGCSAQEAFDLAVMRAYDSHGSDGYSGTIAEKDSYKIIKCPDNMFPMDYANQLLEDDDEVVADKWGPAGCIVIREPDNETKQGKYLFFGWASS